MLHDNHPWGDSERGVAVEHRPAADIMAAGLPGLSKSDAVPEPMFGEGENWALRLHWLANIIATPFLKPWFYQRLRAGKEDPVRFRERLGFPSQPAAARPIVWVHAHGSQAASAARTLIDSLSDRHLVLATTVTRPAAEYLTSRLPPSALHQYAPVDHPHAVCRFLDHWRPAALLWVDSPFSPNLLGEAARRNIPAALVNARLGDMAFRHLIWRKPLYRPLSRTFALITAQSGRDAARLRLLSGRHVYRFGNLQYARPQPQVDEISAAALKRQLNKRLTWAAVYTHPGEEELVAEAHREIRRRFPEAVLLLAPRHGHRIAEIARRLAKTDGVARPAAGIPIDETTSIALLEGPLDAALACRMAPVAFLGGSFVASGGHNPLELAHLGCAVVSGPQVQNYIDPMAELQAAGAVQMVQDSRGLAVAVARLLKDLNFARQRAAAAERVAAQEWIAMTRLLSAIGPILPRL